MTRTFCHKTTSREAVKSLPCMFSGESSIGKANNTGHCFRESRPRLLKVELAEKPHVERKADFHLTNADYVYKNAEFIF